MLEKQGRDDDLKGRYGLHQGVDLGREEDETELVRAKWEAGRERIGLPVDVPDNDGEGSGSGDLSVRATSGTPKPTPKYSASGKAKAVEGTNLSDSLRRRTLEKYNPFDSPSMGTPSCLGSNVGLKTGVSVKVKGRIKDPGVLDALVGSLKSSKGAVASLKPGTSGLLAGYASD